MNKSLLISSTLALSLAPVLLGGIETQAATLVYQGTFGPEAVGATGTGSTTITIDNVANTMQVLANFSGLSGNVTVAHIHGPTANPGTGTAGVMVGMTGFPLGNTSGVYNQNFDLANASTYSAAFLNSSGGTATGAQAALIASLDAGTSYLNIHSSTFGGGEIRAFPTVVPEPITLLGASVAIGLGAAFKRKIKA